MATMLLVFVFVMSFIINFGKRMIEDGDKDRLPRTD